MTTATQRAKIDTPVLEASTHPYRVVVGAEIIGQFSNAKLAYDTAREHRGAAVVFEGGDWRRKEK